ncbi:hypothetical protein ACTFIZ_011497 [Dictyostelium cf. discoideum]
MSFLCSKNSYQQSQISIDIDKSLKNYRTILEGEIRVLILKQQKKSVPTSDRSTTLFKALLRLSDTEITPEELIENRNLVYKTIINLLKKFINFSKNLNIELENNNIQISKLILELDSENFLWNKEIGEICFKLWNDLGIQKTFESQFSHLFGYLFQNLQRISDENYTPTVNDLNMIKLTQNGIIESKFTFEGCNIKVIEIGTQNSSLKKWINCFNEIQVLVYVIDLSLYDIIENEESSTTSINKLDKSLNGFKEIIDSKYLHDCGMVVFFDKMEIFIEKLESVPFNTYDKDYIGNNDLESTTNFIKNKLLNYYSNLNKKLYFLINRENDSNICMSVFRIVKEVVLDVVLNSPKFTI